MPARPGHRRLDVFAEAQHDAALAFRNDVETTREPDYKHETDKQADPTHSARPAASATGAAIAAAPAEETFELAVEIAPQLFEIGRALVARRGAGPTSDR